jgi:ferric-dicitrate binding protein FerR (iron transport regulator)
VENWELVGKKLSGELNAEEAVRFEEWLADDASHQATWKDAQRIWLATGKVDVSFDADTEKALTKFKTALTDKKSAPVRKLFTPLRIAAGVALLLIPTFLVIQFSNEENKRPVIADHKDQVTMPTVVQVKMTTINATDSAMSFFLPDSTHIYLNKNSSLAYPENYNTTARNVTLSGEAFFEVAHDAKKPFVIVAGNTETRVTGTSFNIKEDKENKKVEISVVSGQVIFKSKKEADHLGEVKLSANERVTYSEEKAVMTKQKIKSTENFWWVKNLKGIRKLFKDAKKELTRPRKK